MRVSDVRLLCWFSCAVRLLHTIVLDHKLVLLASTICSKAFELASDLVRSPMLGSLEIRLLLSRTKC